MPLYIKLDFGEEGDIHAWVNRDDVNWGKNLSEANAPNAAACLRKLAKKIGSLERKPQR